jgi:predicted RNA-binding Zn ribbon-like protein
LSHDGSQSALEFEADQMQQLSGAHDPRASNLILRETLLAPSYERFLAFCRQSKVITAAQMRKLLDGVSEFDSQRVLEEVVEIREALYFLILSAVHGRSPDESDLRALNGFLSEARAADGRVAQTQVCSQLS